MPGATRIPLRDAKSSTGDFPHCAATARRAFDLLKGRLALLEQFHLEHANSQLLHEQLSATLDGLDPETQAAKFVETSFARNDLSERLERLERAMQRQTDLILGGY